MSSSYDVAVLGLGAMGAAAAWQLARRGARVLGIDRHAPPHEFGSTHGDTRITRIACGEGPEYSAFALRSHEIWRELEADTGVELLTQNGLLVISGPGDRAASHGVPKFVEATVVAARKAGLDFEMLGTASLRQRYPALAVGDGDTAYHDTVSGFVRPERCITLQLRKAREAGADLRLNETVMSFEQDGSSVVVTTDHGRYAAAQLVVAAGAWLPGLLPARLAGAFKVTRQVLHWFRARDEAAHAGFAPERFPVYIWQVPRQQVIYGFPATGGIEEGVKIATEQEIVTTTPETVDRTVGTAEVAKMYETYVAPFLPGLSPACVKSKVCLYTWVDDARFIIDRHPDHDRIIVASPCSGHGFKHSAAIGELLAQMALEGRAADSRFGFAAVHSSD